MAYATILAKIKSILEGVSDIGQVHDYVRWYKDKPDFNTIFRDAANSQIRAWDISRTSTPETEKASRTNIRTHTFRIRGFMSLDDSAATEKTFQSLVEDVATAFRNSPGLEGTALDSGPIQINAVDHMNVGDALCHYCELHLPCSEEIQWVE